ncbi:MAG: hypothetical protein LDL44_00455 [Caenispirillum sp.]|nr:hypothetical protein [Caenispirillum sp.]
MATAEAETPGAGATSAPSTARHLSPPRRLEEEFFQPVLECPFLKCRAFPQQAGESSEIRKIALFPPQKGHFLKQKKRRGPAAESVEFRSG